MMFNNTLFQSFSPALRLLLLILIIIVSAFVSFFLGMLFAMPFLGTSIFETISGIGIPVTPQELFLMRYVQVINQIGVFVIPSFLFALLFSDNVLGFLGLKKTPGMFSVIPVVLLMYMLLPAIHELLRINQMMTFPEFLSGVENWMRMAEIRAEQLTLAFLKTETLRGLFVNLIIVAVLASICEELLFRPVLINLLKSWIGNVHVAVILSALIFSAFHLQFFSFLPRFLLGLIFGYLFVWSGSVWLPMLAHFINNASAVLVYFMVDRGAIEIPANEFGSVENPALLVISILLSATLLVFIFINARSGLKMFKQEG
jgi:uncharacterized protein